MSAAVKPPEKRIKPGDRLLPMQELRVRLGGISPAAVYQSIKRQKLPPAIKVGDRSSRWLESEIDDALERAVIERDAKLAEDPEALKGLAKRQARDLLSILCKYGCLKRRFRNEYDPGPNHGLIQELNIAPMVEAALEIGE